MTTPCSRPIVVSYTRGSPLASSIIFTRSLPPVPPSIAVACQQSEELKALPTKTTSPSITCNAPTGGVRPDVGEGVRLLGKSTGSYGKPETTRGFVSPKVDIQAWPLSNTTVQEDLL